MATIKYEVIGSQRKLDGTWNVKIRITHNRKVRRVSTPWYATKEQMTKGFKIKDQKLLAVLDDTIKTYRERLMALGISADGMDIDILVQAITTEERVGGISFYRWAEEFVKTKAHPDMYKSAINSFRRYMGVSDVCFHELTSKDIRAWMASLNDDTKAYNLCSALKHVFVNGKKEYNDEDIGIIRVPNNPFDKIKMPRKGQPKKKAVSAEVIRIIAMMPDNKRINSVVNVTRDMFLLSFCMIGLNAVDVYETKASVADGVLSYERHKTRTRRQDRAFIIVRIPEIVKPIFDKYKGVSRTFNLHKRYSSIECFDDGLSDGMIYIKKEVLRIYRILHQEDRRKDSVIAHDLNIESFKFYAARHSWATIARNDVGIDKWTVHEALNHVDKETKIDDVYIKKDFRNINGANEKVLDYVFGVFCRKLDEIVNYIEVVIILLR